jgi:hypothetical protein
MHPIRRVLPVVALTAAALALSGCGGTTSSGSGTAGSTTTVTETPSDDATAEPTAGQSDSSSPASPRGPAGCTTADLQVSLSDGEGAAGSTFYAVRLTNSSDSPCRTGGFGGVSLVGAGGRQIGAPADRTAKETTTRITLRPGQAAEATLQVANAENYPAGRCRPARAKGFRVYPPDETRSVFLARPTTACRNAGVHLLSLKPYQPAE